MAVERLEYKRVKTFGECIYCGKKAHETKLTDEHAMPYSLGGNVILERASCIPCADITKRFEGHLGRKVFWDYRTHSGVQTRNKRDRPTKLPARISARGVEYVQEIDVADHPFFTSYPVWPVPGILSGDLPRRDFKWIRANVFHSIPPNLGQTLGLSAGEEVHIHPPDMPGFDSEKFARAVAKIAYCTALVRWGLHGFRRLNTPALILGRYPYIPYLVGTDPTVSDMVTSPEVAHAVTFSVTEYQRLALLTAHVRLFSNSGADYHGPPTYEVIVGAPPLGWRRSPSPFVGGRREPKSGGNHALAR